MKILLVTPRFPPLVGGQERQSELLASALATHGVEVTVLTERHAVADQEIFSEYTVRYLSVRQNVGKSRLFMFIGSLSYQIKHANEFDLILIRTFCLHSLALGFLKRIRYVKVTSLLMTDSTTEVPDLLKNKLGKLYMWFYQGNTYVNAISSEVYAQLVNAGVFTQRTLEIPNMVSAANFPKEGVLPEKVTRFLYLGNLVRDKGVFDLIDAFSKVHETCPHIELYIAGNGVDRQELEALVSAHSLLNSVVFVGELSKEKTLDFLLSGQCVVYPSYFEGFGLVPFEASLMPLHVISTDVGVISKYLSNRCIIINAGDRDALVQQMHRLASSKADNHYDNTDWIKHVTPKTVIARILKLIESE